MSPSLILIVGIHALVAWILVEIFVNMAHELRRTMYILWHHVILAASFACTFWVYYQVFHVGTSVFAVTMTGLCFLLIFELVVFRYLYSGDRWFLNWTDWILPMFIATSVMHLMGALLT
ncbi:MAG: hypothetical protein P8J32_02715 [bacterium]|jgi:hypothetical protein|nr:hypothetical protein [bacterium]